MLVHVYAVSHCTEGRVAFPDCSGLNISNLTVDSVVIAFGVGVVHLLQVLFVEVLLRRDGGHARRRTGHAHRRAAETLPGRAGVNGTKTVFFFVTDEEAKNRLECLSLANFFRHVLKLFSSVIYKCS